MMMVTTMRRAACLFLALVLAAGCGATIPPATPAPIGSAGLAVDPSITPVPGGQASPPPAGSAFVPPQPGCPAPAGDVSAPPVTVSIGDGPGVELPLGSATISTCTTTSQMETVGNDQPIDLPAHAGDRLRLSLPAGWQFLHWDGFDGPVAGEGGNVWPGTDTPDRPVQIDLPVPHRAGPSLARFTLWVISADGRVVGQLDIRFQVTIG
jgi:hypothetical protein